jgi:2-amino-4-hydroxy-6-hydroxymethyldihydropteridine diphosphokinase
LNDQELWHNAYIALGSNMGDRESCMMTALDLLKEDKDRIHLIDISNIYETAPVGYTDQGSFLNMVCRILTSFDPLELLSALQKIETKLGRKRLIRWGPRTLDLDLLLYDEIEICSETLTVPHPRMFERAFVLVPLRDVYHSVHLKGRLFDDLIKGCEDKSEIKLFRITKE